MQPTAQRITIAILAMICIIVLTEPAGSRTPLPSDRPFISTGLLHDANPVRSSYHQM